MTQNVFNWGKLRTQEPRTFLSEFWFCKSEFGGCEQYNGILQPSGLKLNGLHAVFGMGDQRYNGICWLAWDEIIRSALAHTTHNQRYGDFAGLRGTTRPTVMLIIGKENLMIPFSRNNQRYSRSLCPTQANIFCEVHSGWGKSH